MKFWKNVQVKFQNLDVNLENWNSVWFEVRRKIFDQFWRMFAEEIQSNNFEIICKKIYGIFIQTNRKSKIRNVFMFHES